MISSTVNYQNPSVPSSLTSDGSLAVLGNGSATTIDSWAGRLDEEVTVNFFDARLSQEKFTTDANGFTLLHFPLDDRHVNYQTASEEEICNFYYPEVCKFMMQQIPGATKVIAFHHNVRSSGRINATDTHLRGVQKVVHNDYTVTGAIRKLEHLTRNPPVLTVEELRKIQTNNRRYAFINVWRNTASIPIGDWALAVCDASTLDLDSLCCFERRFEDGSCGEIYMSRFSPKHKWWFYSQMLREECLLLKVWDSYGQQFADSTKVPSEEMVAGTFCLHTSFKDPNADETCIRESIEVRTIVFY